MSAPTGLKYKMAYIVGIATQTLHLRNPVCKVIGTDLFALSELICAVYDEKEYRCISNRVVDAVSSFYLFAVMLVLFWRKHVSGMNLLCMLSLFLKKTNSPRSLYREL